MVNDELLTVEEVNAAIILETSALKNEIEELQEAIVVLIEKNNKLAYALMGMARNIHVNSLISEDFMDSISEHVGFDIASWGKKIKQKFD